MSRAIAVDSNNDIYIGPDGALAMVSDLYAVMQAAQQAAQTQQNEMIYAIDQGMPNFEAVWNGAANIAQFEAYLRRTILDVDGVIGIQGLTTEISNNALLYSVTIETIYGPGVING